VAAISPDRHQRRLLVLMAAREKAVLAGESTAELDVIITKQRERVVDAIREYPKKLAAHLTRCAAAGRPDPLGRTSKDIAAARKAAEETA